MQTYQQLIDDGYLTVTKHPEADLWLYNYTEKTQYEGAWNDTTLSCRGLILNGAGQVMARPFGKFFNIEEHPPEALPNLPFEVFEKLDGSLGILYWHADKPFICTRGSFTSGQAHKANDLLYSRYAHAIPRLRKGLTYLFEIIYPENKIVVDYGAMEGLFLLAIRDTKTGLELPLEDIGFPLVQKFDGINDFKTLKSRNLPNREGYVIRFQNGFRIKVKFEDYVRLHRLMTQFSNVSVWEKLSTNAPLEALLDGVPDEFYGWVKATVAELESRYAVVENECRQAYKELSTRKDTAQYFLTQQYPAILFAMLDNKDYAKMIWQIVRPTYARPWLTGSKTG